MLAVFWILTILGVFAGAVTFIDAMFTANGTPQQAAGAAMAVAMAVLPYCLARAMSELAGMKKPGLKE